MQTNSRVRFSLLAIVLMPLVASAQEILHYKFDEGCGSEVAQFGTAAGNAVLSTTLPGGPDAARVPGKFGGALRGSDLVTSSTRIDTGWMPDSPSGDFSFAMWLRNAPGNPTTIPFGYVFGATGGQLRMYIGPTGNFWLDGFAGVVATGANLTSILNAGWVHIACTVDSGSLEATWYINGAQQLPVPFGGPAWISGNDFTIGARDNLGSSPCALDIDEFVWREGLWSILDIQALFAEPRAAVANYTSGTSQGCGGLVTITSLGGRPTYGNLGFDLQVDHGAAVLVALAAGFDRCSIGAATLPLDAGLLLPQLAGCQLLLDPVLVLVTTSTGTATTFPLPIPAVLPAAATVYFQAATLDTNTLGGAMSSGFVVAVGR